MKFAAWEAGVVIGASFSTPRRDHVPDEMYTARSSRAGTARKALPVSCVAGRTTCASNPTASCTAFVKPPSAVPGIRSSPKMRRGRPRRSRTSPSHVRVPALTRFVVVAFVYSFAIRPVRTKLR